VSAKRLGGFVAILATVACGVSLFAYSVAGTGAYFTDSTTGSISGSVGQATPTPTLAPTASPTVAPTPTPTPTPTTCPVALFGYNQSGAEPYPMIVANVWAIGTLPAGCSLSFSLNSYTTQGPTWPTTGTQALFDHESITLDAGHPSGTLTVKEPSCFGQTDFYTGTTRFDGVDGPLPHYPSPNVPQPLLAWSNGGSACPDPTPTARPTATPKPTPTHTPTPAPTPRTLLKFSGNGTENSTQFTASGASVSVAYSYSCRSYGSGGNFSADFVGADSSDNPIAGALTGSGNGSTTIYLSGTTGPYQVEVKSGCSWTITVTGMP
jgi:hypothetical protein